MHPDTTAMITLEVLRTKIISIEADATVVVTFQGDQILVHVTYVDCACEMQQYLMNVLPKMIGYQFFHSVQFIYW